MDIGPVRQRFIAEPIGSPVPGEVPEPSTPEPVADENPSPADRDVVPTVRVQPSR